MKGLKVFIALAVLMLGFMGCGTVSDFEYKEKDPPPTYLTGGDSTKIVGTWLPETADMFFSKGCYLSSDFTTLTLNEDGTYVINDPAPINLCAIPPESPFGPGGVMDSGTWGTAGNKLIFHPSTGGEYFFYWQYMPEYVDPYFHETHPDTLVLQPSRLPDGAWDPSTYERSCSRSVIYY